jgi:CheY-like chemotaxis protein
MAACILVVDDDTAVRGVVAELILQLGYNVIAATSQEDALQHLASNADIDLLFTDVIMPGGMYGPELAMAATAIRPDLRVVFTTGYSSDPDVLRNWSGSNCPVLYKPYRRSDLAATLAKTIDGRN